MIQPRLCMKLLAAGTIISLLVLVARELILTGGSRPIPFRLVSYLNQHLPYLRAEPTMASNNSVTLAFNSVGPTSATLAYSTDPTSTTVKLPDEKARNITYPKLFSALKPVPGPISFSATVATKGPPNACQRPKSESMVRYIQHTNLTSVQEETANVANADGGFRAPRSCWPPLSRTAVIVPYRNRSENLEIFVPYMHRLLSRQNILFAIFVVEQTDSRLFNRAKLLKIGFTLSQRFYEFDCFVFHDSDKVPENVANVYDCVNAPKLLISEMRSQESSKYLKGKLYHNFFGGVSAITKDAFLKTNGNSNRYYGWGREDDELASRLSISGLRIKYTSGANARYINLRHGNDVVSNKMPWPYGYKVRRTMANDGLKNLNYTGLRIFLHPLFVLIRAEV